VDPDVLLVDEVLSVGDVAFQDRSMRKMLSFRDGGRAIVDAGLKALAFDSGLPVVHAAHGLTYVKASDEHGVLTVDPTSAAPVLGDRVWLIPGHCDPTVNLYDWIVAVRKDRVEALWPVAARGALT